METKDPLDVSFSSSMTCLRAILPQSYFPNKSHAVIINKVTDRLFSLPGFLKAYIQPKDKDPELQDKVLVTFHDQKGFDTLLSSHFDGCKLQLCQIYPDISLSLNQNGKFMFATSHFS